MAYSDRELEVLYGGPSPIDFSSVAPPPAPATEEEVPFRRLKQVANIVPKAINSLAESGIAIGSIISPEASHDPDLEGYKTPAPTFETGPSKGIVDFALDRAAPEVAAWAVPYAGITKGARLLGATGRIGQILTEGIAQGGANFITGAKDPEADLPVSGTVGLGSGILQAALPRWQRALPLAAVSAIEGIAHDNWTGAVANFGFNMLPGALSNEAKAIAPVLEGNKFDKMMAEVDAVTRPQQFESKLNPGEFSFIDQVPSTPIKPRGTMEPDLFNQPNALRLGGETPAVQLPLKDMSRSGLELDKFPFEPAPHPLSTMDDVSTAGLRLEGEPFPTEQPEFPLIKLQSEGIHSPNEPKFTLVPSPTRPTDSTGSLFNWRNDAVNREQPKLLEWHSPTETPTPTIPPAPEVGPKVPSDVPVAGVKEAPITTEPAIAKNQQFYKTPDGQIHLINPVKSGRKGWIADAKENGTTNWNQVVEKVGTKKEAIEKAQQALDAKFPATVEEVPPILEGNKTQDILRKAYDTVKEKYGFPAVQISDVIKESGLPAKTVKDYFHQARDTGEVTLSTGDWSMASEVERTGVIEKHGRNYLQVRYEEPVLAPTKGKAKLKGRKELPVAKPVPQGDVPIVMNPVGDLGPIAPRQDGPHIISTVLDEGDGQYLSGDKWNSPHQKGDSIFTQQIENASGMGKSAFLIQDENGVIRVTSDRMEAAKIAEMAGQRAPDKTGALQSEDLIDPVVKSKPKTVEQHRVAETVEDAAQLADAKKVQAKIGELQQDLAFAREEGDDIAVRGITAAISKMRKSIKSSQAGSITPQTLAIMGAAGVAGLVTYQQTKGDMGATVAAAIIVAGLGTAGAKAFKDFKGIVGPEIKAPTVDVPSATIAKKLEQLAIDTVRTPAGLAVGGRGGPWATLALGAEDMFGLNKLAFYKDLKVKAGGFVDDILNQQAAALRLVAKVKPTEPFAEATSRFIRGQLNDPVEVQRLLNSGGIISTEGGAWSKLTATEKAKYPEKWMQLDDQLSTNTKGDEVTIWHVTNSVKQQLVQGERAALMKLASSPEDQKFAEYAFSTRENFDVLMQTIHAAAGPKEARRLIGTMGQYVTRSHALITDPKFYPDETVIQKAMDNLSANKVDDFLSSVESDTSAVRTASIKAGGKTYMTTPEKADLYENLFTPESLRAVVTQQIKEIKAYGKARSSGILTNDNAQLQGGLFTGRKELDAVRQALLGTHTAPQEMIRDTFNKLLPAAHSAHAMLGLTTAKEASGIPGRFASDVDYNKAVRALKDSLGLAPTPEAQRALQNQLNEISAYLPISSDNPAMGLFQGSFVSRHVYSQLDDIINPFGELSGVMGSGLKKFNDVFKETHLVLNPVVQARNAVQVPFMLVIGRAAHDIKAMQTAFDVVFKDQTSEIARWAVQNGAMSGNPVKGEFNFNMRQLLDGSADNQIFGTLQKGRQLAHLVYSKPDDFVRTATFIAAARREAKALGVPEDKMHLNEQVTNAAREFMTRRTMDYANVPKWVKVGRQIPLLSPFLTYSHEIVRITKNMAVDAAKGDLVSAAGLAGLSVFPFLAQSQAEDSLSSVDKAAWDRGQKAAQDYSRPRFKLPMSRNSDGSFNYFDITPIMPFGDYLMMGRAIKEGDIGAVAAVNPIAGTEKSPFLNLAAAQITGKDIHTQREFRDSWDRAKNVLQSITPPSIPGIGADAARDYPEWLGGKLGQTNLKTGRTYTIKGALLRNVVGVDESQVNPDMAVTTMVKIAQHDIANERQYLNDALRADGLSPQAKQRAIDRYSGAVKMISDQLHERIKN